MQKNKENLFSEKFRLLNSQEHTEEINWSCSDSSDFENVPITERVCNLSNKVRTRKRKRKKKVPKNISNLDITILDAPKEVENMNKSPILQRKSKSLSLQKSPVLASTPQFFPPYKCTKVEPSSPIITCKVAEQHPKINVPDKSPILLLKYSSPRASPKVKKKLFKVTETRKEIEQTCNKEDSIDVSLVNIRESERNLHLDRRKNEECCRNNKINRSKYESIKNYSNETNDHLPRLLSTGRDDEIKLENDCEDNVKLKSVNGSINEPNDEDDSFKMLKTENVDLVKRVKSYFDSHFSSGTTSQHSISDCTTQQNSKTSDEFDIISFVTQVNSNRASSQSEQDAISKNPSPISSQSAEINDKPKKIRYKKNGLSFRLNTILKKQNANVSLWQHEKFLAESSNFVIPKGEHLVFQIQKAEFKYGCYLLEVVDVNNLHFLILINSCYVQNVNITQNMILKLYDPYKIVEFKEDCKLIINTCKFECISLRQ